MTLDEAIAKAKEDGDVQLAEWLRQARGAAKAARWYTRKVYELESENAKLRELLLELYEIAQPEAPSMFEAEFADRMRELGVEL